MTLQTYEEYMDSLYMQPELPAGFNSVDNNGDDVDGAGINWGLGITRRTQLISFTPLIITPEMMDVFDEGCADYVVPCVNDTIVIRAVRNTVSVI